MTNPAHLPAPDDPDDDLWPHLEDTGPDDDLADASGRLQAGGTLARADDVLDLLLPLIGPERAGPMALWCALVDEHDRTLPAVMPIADVPLRPDIELVRRLVGQLGEVLDDLYDQGGTGGVVFAVVRRSGGDRGAVELAWVDALRLATADAGVRLRAVAAVGRDRARVLQW
jgi:hypothetical protein